MKVDLVVDPTNLSVADIVDAAAAAESAGFDGVWTYDHLSGVSLDGSWAHDVWTVLAAVAGETRRVAVGPLVVNLTIRNPAHVALAAASLQDLSAGRAMLGVGAGAGPESPYSREMSMMGITAKPAPIRRQIVEDAIGMIRSLWAGAESYSSEHFRLDGVSRFLQPSPAPPIIVGSNGPKMCALAGRVADGVNIHWSEQHLGDLVVAARNGAIDRDFVVTVEAQLSREWAPDPNGVHQRLSELGVGRLMLAWHRRDGLESIESALAVIQT